MVLMEYKVRKHDSIFSILSLFNVTLEQLISINIRRYPGLKDNPFLIMEDWDLLIPSIGNGGKPD